MLVNTKSTLYTYFENAFVGKDGNPVKSYKIQLGAPGEQAVEIPCTEEVFNKLQSAKQSYSESFPVTLDIRQFGNKLSVRCVSVG